MADRIKLLAVDDNRVVLRVLKDGLDREGFDVRTASNGMEALEQVLDRLERGEATRFVEQLLGLTLERDDYELGAGFCDGVVERAGMEGLNRLWESPRMAPTGPELEAPGLWLARIDLDLD